jgi:hypothetical protein
MSDKDFPEIEDVLLETLRDMQIFNLIDSIGRNKSPEVLIYPAAGVYFYEMTDTGVRSRPAYDELYNVVIKNQNVQSEAAAAKDTYSLIKKVRDAIHGKALGIENISCFRCSSIKITGYEDDGEIEYTLTFKTTNYRPLTPE